MEMIDIVLWIALGVVIGVCVFYFALKLAVQILARRLAYDIETLEEALKEHVDLIPCRVEQHDGVFFVYNNDTNEFMAQGSTLAELRERIKTRWKDQRVSVVAGDEAVLEQLKAQLNESSSS
jgi:lipopolysaccharide export LptBFGC system permease protein LptF